MYLKFSGCRTLCCINCFSVLLSVFFWLAMTFGQVTAVLFCVVLGVSEWTRCRSAWHLHHKSCGQTHALGALYSTRRARAPPHKPFLSVSNRLDISLSLLPKPGRWNCFIFNILLIIRLLCCCCFVAYFKDSVLLINQRTPFINPVVFDVYD